MRLVGSLISTVLVLMISLPNLYSKDAPQVLQPTPAPKPTQMVPIENPDQWPLLLYESFDDNRNDWPMGGFKDRYATGAWEIAEGEYKWDVTAHQDVSKQVTPNVVTVSDFFLTVEATRIWGPEDSSYGVIFQDEGGEDLYYFGISDIGTFSFFLLYQNQWQALIDWTSTDTIKSGGTNKITIVAAGSHFSLEINDEFVGEVQDDHLDLGQVGLAIELYNQNDHAGFAFDNFELRAPSSGLSHHVETYDDDFSDTDSGWGGGEWKGGSWGYGDDHYRVITTENGELTWGFLTTLYASDVVIEVEAEQVSAPDNNHNAYGVLCRFNQEEDGDFQGYFVGITGNGYYSIYRMWSGGNEAIIDWTPSDAIQRGNAINHLHVECEGNHIILEVNEQHLVEAEDHTYINGHIGFFVGTYEEEPTEIHFDNLVVQSSIALDQVDALLREAESLLNQGDREGAQEKYKNVLAHYQEEGDQEVEAKILEVIGDAYRKYAEYELALDSYQKALEIWRGLGDQQKVAELLVYYLGETSDALNDLEQVSVYYQEALEIWRVTQNWVEEAETLNRLGIVNIRRSDYEEAMTSFQQALEIWREKGDRLNETRALNNIGVVYGYMGDHEQALPYFEQSLSIALEIDDPWREAIWRTNIGDTYSQLGEIGQALDYFHQARILFEQIDEPRRSYEAGNLLNIGRAYLRQDDYESASNYLNQALEIMREVNSQGGEATAFEYLGAMYLETGDTQEAFTVLFRALEIRDAMGEMTGKTEILALLGEVYEEEGDDERALEKYLEAIDVAETIVGGVKVQSFQSALMGQSAEVYQKAVRMLVGVGRLEEAFNLSERGRARAFLDAMGNKRPDLQEGADAELLEEEEELRRELAELEETLQEERSKPIEERDKQLIVSIEDRVQNRHQVYRELLDSIELTNPELASLVSTPTISISETQALLSEDMTLVSYYLTDEGALVFIIRQDMFHVQELPASTEDITTGVENFRHLGLANLENPVPRTLKNLYAWLVEPVEDYLKTSLVGVVPHQALHYLPFAALTDGERIFGDDHILFQLPSISTFPYLKYDTARSVSTALVLGDPKTGNPDLPRLNYAVHEADLVANLFNVEAYTGEKASEVVLKSEVGTAGVLHLAVHGGFNLDAPLFSRLWLSPGGEEDGRLNIYEVYGLDLDRAGLVVLSACETQLGELSAGDEVVGLNRAFLYSAPTVVASLWSVDDEATGVLMESFYRHLLEGMGKAQALQAAQLEVRDHPEHPEWAHPYYWAAFVLNGDPGEIVLAEEAKPVSEPLGEETKPIGLYVVLGALCGLGGIIGIAFYIRRKRGKSLEESEYHVRENEKIT